MVFNIYIFRKINIKLFTIEKKHKILLLNVAL